MNKKIKVIELLNLLAENKIKRGTRIKYGNYTFKIDYPNLCGIYIEGGLTRRENSLFSQLDICALNYEVEILEDEQEIDIQNIEENKTGIKFEKTELFTSEGLNFYFEAITMLINEERETQNKLIKAVKQLDKKINKEK